MSIAIIDYEIGNLFSIEQAFKHFGAEVEVTGDPQKIRAARATVLPGVGSFKRGMDTLKNHGLLEVTQEAARSGRPFLGICLGMQMLFDSSEEFGEHQGLGLIPGAVRKINLDPSVKVPHVSWTGLESPEPSAGFDEKGLFSGVSVGEAVYFTHSFVAHPIERSHVLGEFELAGVRLCAAVQSDQVYGCQFHPEKSGPTGLRVIKNFIDMVNH